MEICLIGNSHIACIREAWSEKKDLNITFFGSHGRSIENTENIDGKIYATKENVRKNFKLTSCGKEFIDLERYDAIIIHGLMPRPRGYLSFVKEKTGSIYYSSRITELANPYRRSVCFYLVNEIRKTSSIPIFSSSSPNLASPKPYTIIDKNVFDDIQETIRDILKVEDVNYLSQHPETVLHYIHTKEKFTKESRRLDVHNISGACLHPGDDREHMNKEFGAFYLENLRKNMDAVFVTVS